MEELVGSKGYKLPSYSKYLSKDAPENLLKNTMTTSHSARIPKMTKVDKSDIPHRKNLFQYTAYSKNKFLSTGYPVLMFEMQK